MDKDRAIITQVAAKIAADLVDKTAETDLKLGEFAALFTSVKEIIFESIDAQSTSNDAKIYEMAKETFNATAVEGNSSLSTNGPLQIVGKQHGDLPDWLIKACKRDGVTKVYDNRDGLSVNPKRPWFKAVDADKAYWAPRTR
jgi:hypothetical protein